MRTVHVRYCFIAAAYDNYARWLERAWCNDDNTDAKGLQLAAHALRQRIQAGLAGRVG